MTTSSTAPARAPPCHDLPGRGTPPTRHEPDLPDLLLDGAAGRPAVLRAAHDPRAQRGVLLSFTELRRLRRVGLHRVHELRRTCSRTTGSSTPTPSPSASRSSSTVLVNVIALAIAIGLNSRIKFRTALRGIFFIPNILSILVIGYVFNYLFSNSLPEIASRLGIDAPVDHHPGRTPTSRGSASSSSRCGRPRPSTSSSTSPGSRRSRASSTRRRRLDGASTWRQFTSITFPLIGAVLHHQHGAVAEELPPGLRPHHGPHRRRTGNVDASRCPCSSTEAGSRAASTPTRPPTR